MPLAHLALPLHLQSGGLETWPVVVALDSLAVTPYTCQQETKRNSTFCAISCLNSEKERDGLRVVAAHVWRAFKGTRVLRIIRC